MPELPEVETVRRTLERAAVGRVVKQVTVHRKDVVRQTTTSHRLLRDCAITGTQRHGKQIAIVGQSPGQTEGCLCIHLGMSGTLGLIQEDPPSSLDQHDHVVWLLKGGGRLVFRDPRRFGGIWAFSSLDQLQEQRWSKLGPDALNITPSQLHRALQKTKRPIKAALLDQNLLAGLGNIYTDELLHACRWHPIRRSNQISLIEVKTLIRRLRTLLNEAIRQGGSTLKDHTDAQGLKGSFQTHHKAYGRAGQPCLNCQQPLSKIEIIGRTTIFCSRCQAG